MSSVGAMNNAVNPNTSADDLIAAFKDAEVKLRIALQTGDEEQLPVLEREADLLIDQLIDRNFETRHERQMVMQFLVDRFVLEDQSPESLPRRICDKLISSL